MSSGSHMKGFFFFGNDNFTVSSIENHEACQSYRLLLPYNLSIILHYLFSWSNIDGFCYKYKEFYHHVIKNQ